MIFLWKAVLVSLSCYNEIRLTGWFKQHIFVSHTLEAKSEIKVLADLVLDEGPLPGLQVTPLLPVSSCGRERKLWSFPVHIRILILSLGPHPHDLI